MSRSLWVVMLLPMTFAAGPNGCTARQAVNFSGTVKDEPPAAMVSDGFSVELKSALMTAQRTWQQTSESSQTRPTLRMNLSLRIQDTRGNRIFRIREGSGLTSVVDGQGRELVVGAEGKLRSLHSQSEFFIPGDPRTDGRAAMRTLEFTDVLPRSFTTHLRSIKANFTIDVVAEDRDLVFEPTEVEKPIQLTDRLTATVKLKDIDEEKGTLRQFSIEIRSAMNASDVSPAPIPDIQKVEVLNAKGIVLAEMALQERSAVGNVTRSRYVLKPLNRVPSSKEDSLPASVRLRVFSKIESVSIPCHWGPIRFSD